MYMWIVLILVTLKSDSISGYRKPKVFKEDCILHGIRHGVTWQDPLLPCIQKKCINGRVINKMTGCLYSGKCYRVNERWKEGCSHRTCVYFEDYHMGRKYHFYFVDGTAWCLTPDSQCKAPGTEWEYECQHYRCIEKEFERVKEARIQKIGKLPNCTCCKHNGKCYSEGSMWSDDTCTDYYCDMVNNGGQMMEAITSVPGCEFKGKCYKFAETVVHNCFLLECSTSDGTHIKWEPIKKACPVGNRCVNVNESWRNQSSCMEYYCDTNATTITKQYGCMHKDRCIPFGENFYDEFCYYRLCSLKQNMAVNEVESGGCSGIDGSCYTYGESGFSKVIHGEVVVNCTCEQRGASGSLTSCVGKGHGDVPNIITYHLDDSKTGSEMYIRKDKDMTYNNITSSVETGVRIQQGHASVNDESSSRNIPPYSNTRFNKNMKINEENYNKLNSIQDDIKVNANSMTNIRKGDNLSPILEGENIINNHKSVLDTDNNVYDVNAGSDTSNKENMNILGFNTVPSSEKKMDNVLSLYAVPNLELKPIPIYRNNGFSEGTETNRPDSVRDSMSGP